MVKKWNVVIPKLSGDKPRRAYIYLPESYEKEPEKRYPVMYMFDGHNVFFDSDATYGKSWGMYKYMKESKKQLIIVAVECNHEGNKRLIEYAPLTYENSSHGKIKGKGSVYMNWLVKTLKPYIDENYRTLPDREHTIIAGSSMGGLMALYAVTHYNRWFSKGGCVSSAVGFCMRPLMSDLRKSSISPDTRIYLSWGSREAHGCKDPEREDRSSKTYKWNRQVRDVLEAKGARVTMYCQVGGAHCEADWEKQNPIYMDDLWK